MIKVYGDIYSGNCYKIKLLMALLGIEHEWIAVDILAGETHTEAFKQKNPNSRIPVLEIDSETFLCESNAILNYLADGSDLLPQDRYARAQVLQWQFFEQYSHEPFIATARYINKYLGLPKEREAEYHAKQEGGHKALGIMEQRLTDNDWLVGNSMSIADITLYAYTHVADEGGFELSGYPAINAWFSRIESQPGYVTMAD